jgi:hypothetical protein
MERPLEKVPAHRIKKRSSKTHSTLTRTRAHPRNRDNQSEDTTTRSDLERKILRAGWITALILMTLQHVIEMLKGLVKMIVSWWQ